MGSGDGALLPDRDEDIDEEEETANRTNERARARNPTFQPATQVT
jgi:hypothetical protein